MADAAEALLQNGGGCSSHNNLVELKIKFDAGERVLSGCAAEYLLYGESLSVGSNFKNFSF